MPVEARGRVVLASGNAGKLRELEKLLEGTAFELVPQSALEVVEAEETGATFVENALLKARNAARATGLPAIADDSGIVVDALGGAPGIYSARYAGAGATDADNIDAMLAALRDVPEAARTARFVCVIVYLAAADDPVPVIAQGMWEGRVLEERRGSGGFGYDPVFFATAQGRAVAELSHEVKNASGHRGQALRALLARLRQSSMRADPVR